MIQHHSLDYADAKNAIDAILEEAQKRGKAVVAAVGDSHGELILFARLDGAPLTSITVATNKVWSAARERKATKDIGARVRHPEDGFDIAYFGDPKFLGWGGGVPVLREGKVVGAVAVSGISEDEDIELANLGVAAIG